MSVTRDQVLKQLGLMPLWRLREAEIASPQQAPHAEAEATPVETAVSHDVASMDWATLHQHINGSGDPNADWLLVGDVPADADATTLLDKMLMAIQLQRGNNVYLTPLSDTAYLKRQVTMMQPKLIFVFGEQAAQTLLSSQQTLDELRGKVHQYENVALVVSYAPSHLLNHAQDKAKAWADLCLARDWVKSLGAS
jgi:uracil-DNA glycosylase